MTHLQVVMACVWTALILGGVYSIGAAWGGWKSGLAFVVGLLFQVAFWIGVVFLLYYTGKALFVG